MPSLQAEEIFEDDYRRRFEQHIHDRGLLIDFRRDRAALDLGVMLTAEGTLQLSGTKVWFQLKGVHAATLGAEQLRQRGTAPVTVKLEHLRFWYAGPEATYLVLYVEATGQFLAEDVRDIVDRQWGPMFLTTDGFAGQDTVTVHLRADAVLDHERLRAMLAHRSMRIDGPSFRGRPLGHRLDPLRCQLATLDPDDFQVVVHAVLAAHGYRPVEDLDPGLALADLQAGVNEATLQVGILHNTYEWIFQLSVEFGYSDPTEPRDEGQVFSALGTVAVLIHKTVPRRPRNSPAVTELIENLRQRGITRLLVFANAPDDDILGFYRVTFGTLCPVPQGLGSFAYNVLTCTLVYLDHRERLPFQWVNYQT